VGTAFQQGERIHPTTPHIEMLQLVMLGCALITCLHFFFLAEEEEGWELTDCAWYRQWGCAGT